MVPSKCDAAGVDEVVIETAFGLHLTRGHVIHKKVVLKS